MFPFVLFCVNSTIYTLKCDFKFHKWSDYLSSKSSKANFEVFPQTKYTIAGCHKFLTSGTKLVESVYEAKGSQKVAKIHKFLDITCCSLGRDVMRNMLGTHKSSLFCLKNIQKILFRKRNLYKTNTRQRESSGNQQFIVGNLIFFMEPGIFYLFCTLYPQY